MLRETTRTKNADAFVRLSVLLSSIALRGFVQDSQLNGEIPDVLDQYR